MRKSLAIISLLVAAIFATIPVSADSYHEPEHDLKADGIYYNICEDGLEVQLSPIAYYDDDAFYPMRPHAEYAGDVVVPESVFVPSLERELPVVSLAKNSFACCDSLKTVKLPATLKRIGENVFDMSMALTFVDMSACSNITAIVEGMFEGTAALDSVALPPYITEIHTHAFLWSGIKYFAVPDEVTYLADYAFTDSGLRHLKMGKSLKSIGEYALKCPYLERVEWNDVLYGIGVGGFSSSRLATVEYPASVRFIGFASFGSMDSLRTVVCRVDNPDLITISNLAFDLVTDEDDDYVPIPRRCVLYVPAQSVELYRQADVWKEFAEIRAIDDEETALEQLTPAAGTDGATYDLMGRRVSSPRPGQLVVSGGKLRFFR